MKTAFRIIGFFLLVVLFAVVVPQCYLILKWAIMNIYLFKWFGIGLLAYMVVRRLLRKNEEWFATFIHELTHAMVSILFFRKIHSFHAEEGVGQMSSSSGRFGNIFITLAPYCLPILTFLFLFLRLLAAQEALFVFDILIGFTMAFHIYWFFKTMGTHQSDIRRYALPLSYIFIVNFLLLNISLVLLSFKSNVLKAFCELFAVYWHQLCVYWNVVF